MSQSWLRVHAHKPIKPFHVFWTRFISRALHGCSIFGSVKWKQKQTYREITFIALKCLLWWHRSLLEIILSTKEQITWIRKWLMFCMKAVITEMKHNCNDNHRDVKTMFSSNSKKAIMIPKSSLWDRLKPASIPPCTIQK